MDEQRVQMDRVTRIALQLIEHLANRGCSFEEAENALNLAGRIVWKQKDALRLTAHSVPELQRAGDPAFWRLVAGMPVEGGR